MKKIVFITLSLLLAVSFWNCEKDDICASGTPVTPRVIIEFYDAADPSVLKNVTNLGVIAPTFSEGKAFNNVSKIEVPLRTTADVTTLNFIQNGSDTNTTNDNVDEITFNYQRVDEYISRACGFKTLFYLNDTNPIELTVDGNNWIQSIEVLQPNIETENEVHVKIYF
ncbi:MAG: hypothetical protein EKK56_02275 [Flavobacteriaceae bacterium]|uniref:DUF6452 family protein n=1 Tax=uncultured Flavobacterium sp. TaxID=165435 RepID=UPI000F91D364|nr:DUF6452 family protein [uncultured Flavobacterium sp.]RTL14098.1 MAG: hypothetical protein EKK56_02275 [Flavobacteriaceae bacterium]TXI71219.1 MAG: hypothetical protein E6Q45_01020 [Flavobacterium sp.]